MLSEELIYIILYMQIILININIVLWIVFYLNKQFNIKYNSTIETLKYLINHCNYLIFLWYSEWNYHNFNVIN